MDKFDSYGDGSVAVIELLSKDELSGNTPKEGMSAEDYRHGLWLRLNGGVAINFLAAVYRFCLSIGVNSYAEWEEWKRKHGIFPTPVSAALEWAKANYVKGEEFFDHVLGKKPRKKGEGTFNKDHRAGLKKLENEVAVRWLRDTKEWLEKSHDDGDHDTDKAIRRLRRRAEEIVDLTEHWMASNARTAAVAAEFAKTSTTLEAVRRAAG